jgi:hypothetical protein
VKNLLIIFKDLSDTIKGVLFIIAGLILLLHTLGIIQRGLDILIIGLSIYMIIYGFIKANYHQKIILLIKGKK